MRKLGPWICYMFSHTAPTYALSGGRLGVNSQVGSTVFPTGPCCLTHSSLHWSLSSYLTFWGCMCICIETGGVTVQKKYVRKKKTYVSNMPIVWQNPCIYTYDQLSLLTNCPSPGSPYFCFLISYMQPIEKRMLHLSSDDSISPLLNFSHVHVFACTGEQNQVQFLALGLS